MSDPKYRYPYPPHPTPPPRQGYNYYQGSVMDFRPHNAQQVYPQYPQQAYPHYPHQAYPHYPQQAFPHLHTHHPCVGSAQYFRPGNTPPPPGNTRLVALLAGTAVVDMVEGVIDMVNQSYSNLDMVNPSYSDLGMVIESIL